MAKLNITLSSCVRVSSKNSTCKSCADICPHDSITFNDNVIQVDKSCDDCGLCLGVCPTETISLDGFNTIDKVFDFLQSDKSSIYCSDDIPCIGVFDSEYILSISLLNSHETLELVCCQNCYSVTEQKISEVNYLLKKLGSTKKVDMTLNQPKEEKEDKSRRDFLKKLTLQESLDSTKEFNNLIGKSIKQKILPNKRKLLYMAIKRVNKLEVFQKIQEGKISFISKKIIDNSCDNCSFCYRICPSGALSTDTKGSVINFDTLLCLKCKLCHDVCESDSISIDSFDMTRFFEPKVEELIEFDIRRCEDCGIIFTPKNSEKMCRRCTIEDEEARDLWGI